MRSTLIKELQRASSSAVAVALVLTVDYGTDAEHGGVADTLAETLPEEEPFGSTSQKEQQKQPLKEQVMRLCDEHQTDYDFWRKRYTLIRVLVQNTWYS